MPHPTSAYDHDVVIVGASFAGAACALAAAQYGLRVCVLERKADPGERLHTTGIVVKEAIEQTWLCHMPEHLQQRVERVRLYAPNLRSVRLAAPGYYFLTTDTPNLMRWLAAELRASGVDLRLQQSFSHAVREGDGWQVEGAGRCAYLVGADGARSRVAQRTGLGQVRDMLYGVEREFDGLHLGEGDALHCFVSRHFAPGYIGWAAQNPNGVQLGLALRHDPARACAPDMEGFIEYVRGVLGIAADISPSGTRAGLVPCGLPDGPITGHRLILTGDAAGIVSPLSAGGIHSSWRHGWAVGDAIGLHLRGKGPAAEQVARRVAPSFRRKRVLRWAMDHLQRDWPVNALLRTAASRRVAEQIYFHRRGVRA
ncbi:TPA: NAD(P)/FAD-dependent oxidoreductase [Stenotrophomonas maltophilia]|nr:NAD(P)/FAD-dependent oxidoreductase [Stenotrophomonas maltophilia]HDS1025467.1 NAD(P)/FAD-dependent oxidoreductase [Stenotrophomonas maltophilia]HDS1029140.1 NAD(P)/FAD-dependent oxidoreductase [Stenotrophomonas maltophilia]HDS1033772.1 NAD(P)/FAD-dependent oxidoreductase [Stenotrophomonas maltophilia]